MVHTIRIGEITIDQVVEMELPMFDPFAFLPGLTPEVLEENRAWLQPRALDPATGQLVMCIQSYVVRTPTQTILIDTCSGNHKDRPGYAFWDRRTDDTYITALAAQGLSPGDIDVVMCTHLHLDHVGWNTRLLDGRWVPTFPNAKYLFAEREFAWWKNRAESGDSSVLVAAFKDSVLPIMEAGQATLIRSDAELAPGIVLEPTPGHTLDHFSVHVGSGAAKALITGDVLHTPLQARYPELSMRSDHDMAQAAATRRRLLECVCETDTLFCTMHFPFPSTGRVTRWGGGFRVAEAVA